MDPLIRQREDANRYELLLDGAVVSHLDSADDGRQVTFPHTVTSPHAEYADLVAPNER